MTNEEKEMFNIIRNAKDPAALLIQAIKLASELLRGLEAGSEMSDAALREAS